VEKNNERRFNNIISIFKYILNSGLISAVINVQLISAKSASPYLCTINVCMGMGRQLCMLSKCVQELNIEITINRMCLGLISENDFRE
jgi:hypothetical protein